MPEKNQLVELTIEDLTHEGSGIGRLQPEGIAVFVPESAVGDRLLVKLVKINKTYCFGRIEQILSASPDRIESDCPVSRRCGGCVYRHISYEAELRQKAKLVHSNLERIGGISIDLEPIVPSPEQTGYRNKAQYPIRMQKGQLAAGFFAPRSHEVIHCHSCKLQPDFFRDILECVLEYIRTFQISIYDEQTKKGLIRHLYLREGRKTGEIMVCLVVNGTKIPYEQELIKRLTSLSAHIVSILLNTNKENTNVILGKQTTVLYGKAEIEDQLCGINFSISPHAFYQVNHDGAERLYGIAAEYAQLSGTQTLLDLYCGAGTIGLSMASKCKQVIGVEVVPQAIQNAKQNAKANGIENVRFLCKDASQAAAQLAQEGISPDVVILDPPRKGCEESLLQTVVKMMPNKIVYVSCNSATLARDCKILSGMGYQILRARPVDMFARTNHVETCVLLQRQSM